MVAVLSPNFKNSIDKWTVNNGNELIKINKILTTKVRFPNGEILNYSETLATEIALFLDELSSKGEFCISDDNRGTIAGELAMMGVQLFTDETFNMAIFQRWIKKFGKTLCQGAPGGTWSEYFASYFSNRSYREDFYTIENVIGYSGELNDYPTFYFRTSSEYGHITQKHNERNNVGREVVRLASQYEYAIELGKEGNMIEYSWKTHGSKALRHRSRHPFTSISNPINRDTPLFELIYLCKEKYPYVKGTQGAILSLINISETGTPDIWRSK